MNPVIPPRLNPADVANFKTLLAASDNQDVAVCSAIRKSDGKPVALVCAMWIDNDQMVHPVPLAVMVEGNPYELFEDFTQLDLPKEEPQPTTEDRPF